MPRKSTRKEKVDAYIARLSPLHKQFVESLRKIVVKASSKLEEKYMENALLFQERIGVLHLRRQAPCDL